MKAEDQGNPTSLLFLSHNLNLNHVSAYHSIALSEARLVRATLKPSYG